MPISQLGNINTAALVVPDLYVQIVPPQNLVLNGVPTNRIGVVGTASWGPVGQPIIVGNAADYYRAFGPVINRRYEMGTQVSTAIQQGAQDFRCVRVSSGMDVAATGTLGTASLVLTGRYTGTLGNTIVATIAAGSKSGTWRLTIGMPGQQPEVFDNIYGATPTVNWQIFASVINNGNGPLRGPSQLVVASLGATPTTVLAAQSITLSGGTDGEVVNVGLLVGNDTVPRKGMYALRSQGCSILVVADADDPTYWTVIDGFALSEGMYAILAGQSGDTIANAISTKATAGLDSYASKLMFGDLVYWNDQANQVLRLVSPAGFVAGRLANLSPEQSSLNKPLYGVAGTQKSGLPGAGLSGGYSTAELSALFQAGIDVIANPQPGGAFWGVRAGHNSSSNPATNGDNYTRLTNFIAATVNAGMGRYVGQLINAGIFRRARATLMDFLQNLLQQGILGSTDGSLPFSVVCDVSNNPFSRTSLGYLQADVQIRYQAINEKFIVNVEGGQTVVVSRQTLPSGQQ